MPEEKSERTTGIDIEDWCYPDSKKLFNFGRAQRTPVHFIAWDFAGPVSVGEINTESLALTKYL